MKNSKKNEFLLFSILQSLFAFEAYGDFNMVGGIVSLIFTLLFYFLKKDLYFVFNCLLNLVFLFLASKNPMLSNSTILLCLVSSIFVYEYFKTGEIKNNPPTMILIVAVVYLVSGLHKLNDGFFYSESSCATWFLNFNFFSTKMLNSLDNSRKFLAGVVLFSEIFLGLAFFIPRIRKMTFYLMVLFHSIALIGNPIVEPFGLLMLSLVAISFWSEENSAKSPNVVKLLSITCFLILVGIYLNKFHYINTDFIPGFFTLFLVWFLIKSEIPNSMKKKEFDFQRFHFLLPICYFLYSISGPYIGFRETGSLNMYSNLIPASQKTNHFFLGKIFPYLVDPWKFRIKIYELKYRENIIYLGDLLIVPDEFENTIEKLLIVSSDPQSMLKSNDLQLRLKIYGENVSGSYSEILKRIDESKGLFRTILSRITIPLNDEYFGEKKRSYCAW